MVKSLLTDSVDYIEDKNLDGNFGAADLDSLNPTRWNMAMPVMTLTME